MDDKRQAARYIYRFGAEESERAGTRRGKAADSETLGGKGASLAEMTRLGIPVPPGFTISTDACRHFLKRGAAPEGLNREIKDAVAWLELQHAQRFGDDQDPLLVSVRSGAAVSMPGMMDTILNLGIHDGNVQGLAARRGNARLALDSYRRLLQMFGMVVLRAPKSAFDGILEAAKRRRGAAADSELDPAALGEVIASFQEAIERHAGEPFPMDPREQLRRAIEAVFRSWNNERARYYRGIHGIADDLGSAVTIQAMVFGNGGLDSGAGVGFTRNPSTGERETFGEFLVDAQGEDIVAGIRTPAPLTELERTMPKVYAQLRAVTGKLERHYQDVQDFEFTVERGRLFLLQTRTAKRSPQAALRCAVEMAEEGLITRRDAILRVKATDIDAVLSPQLDLRDAGLMPITSGLPASPGSAAGRVALTADRAVELAGKGNGSPVILVRRETAADDIHGLDAAAGFLTACGGATSHAAVVARGMGKCCITGAGGIAVDETAGTLTIGGHSLREGDWLSLDGSSGRVFLGRIPMRPPEAADSGLAKLLSWAREFCGAAVRANADTPGDAMRARGAQAAGIGLCRTEHMFFSPERLIHMRSMILASTREERRRAIDALLPAQQSDFEEMFRAMSPLPVTVRLIDPPLHEFLPTEGAIAAELARAQKQETDCRPAGELEALLVRVRDLSESNPMLGLRGCRLGITCPEIIVMQVRAILTAALQVESEGLKPLPEIMAPLVACVEEIRYVRTLIDRTAADLFRGQGRSVGYRVGAMIELPRAAVCAGMLAKEVDFLSFGTNDLTQMTFGFCRDDARKFLDSYLRLGILSEDPFLTIDREGVGGLIRSAIVQARAANSAIKIGICGEHGGDPASIAFFHEVGVDYVSCSPARIPVAQLSMAQAALAGAVSGAAENGSLLCPAAP